MYWRPAALVLKNAGFFVSVVNAMLTHDFSDNSIHKVKQIGSAIMTEPICVALFDEGVIR